MTAVISDSSPGARGKPALRPRDVGDEAICGRDMEQRVFRVMLRCAGPGKKPGDRVAFQFQWQRPQGCPRGWACPLQVIQAHQNRSYRSPLFQQRAQLVDPPPGRI